ncbi:MAG TPA: YihY/virulence factor BrkB family protein, partial [Burkholderiales bacterium]
PESAAIGFFAAFSIAPMLLVVIAVAGYFFGPEAVQGRLITEIDSMIGKEGAVAVQAMVASAWKTRDSGWIGVISAFAVIIGASATFVQLTNALNWIWRAPAKKGAVATLIKVRLLSFGLVLGTGFLLIVMLVLDAMLAFAGNALMANREIAEPVIDAVQHTLTFVVLLGAFTVLLKVLPEVHVRWRDAALGALVAAVLFSIGKHLLALYLAHAGTASAFGAAGSLAVLMMWLFFSAGVFLLGAEVAAHALPKSQDPESRGRQ